MQSESFTGEPFATYWMHNGLLTKDGKKISKSDPGTIVLMSDLLESHAPDTLRALFLTSHYRRPTDYGPSRLDEIARGLQAFHKGFERFEQLTGTSFYRARGAPTSRRVRPRPVAAPAGDRRASRALPRRDGRRLQHRRRARRALRDHPRPERFANALTPEQAGPLAEYRAGMVVLKELTRILGLFLRPAPKARAEGDRLTGPLLDLLVQLRTQVRKEKNFALADDIRKRLAALGVVLEDRPDGTAWRIESDG